MSHLVKHQPFSNIALLFTVASIVAASFAPQVFAADISEKAVLPTSKACTSATYISNMWNEKTKKATKNNALAYKKLICNSGREAFILIMKDKNNQKHSYKLIDHSNANMSEKGANMCQLVNQYCK